MNAGFRNPIPIAYLDLDMEPETKAQNVYIATFGCQMNEYDSASAMRLLAERGWTRTREVGRADLIFINTCSIREKAEQKVYSYLGRLRPLKEANPGLIIALGGCVAQQQAGRLFKNVPFLDIVLGTHGIHRLPDLVEEAAERRRSVCDTDFTYDFGRPPDPAPGAEGVTAFLTIMQGCDNFCAYCVVPYVRGRETSRPPEELLAEAQGLAVAGVREITLLGQNVNSYGRGLESGIGFADLLESMAGVKGIDRLRFTTSHPKDLSPRLIRAIAELEPLCEHIHLPVQSGSNAVLKAMRRGYTRDDYLARVDALREACPDVAVTTDVIVGFPGETESDYQDTIRLARRVDFDGMYSFKYSDRPMTRASRMTGKVDEETKKRRLAELQALQKEITIRRNRALIGQRVEVLVEGRSGRYPDQLSGRTRGHKVVNFTGPSELIGRLVRPVVVDAWANSLRGRIEDASFGEGGKGTAAGRR